MTQASPVFFQQKVDKVGAAVVLKNIDEFTTEQGTAATSQPAGDEKEPPSPIMSRLQRSDSGRLF